VTGPRWASACLTLPLVLLFFSGCLGGASDPASESPAPPTGSVDATQIVAAPAQADDTTGAVEGLVMNENAAVIAKAYVILVGSRNSTTTDREGRFSISHVVPGAYTLRVDAELYRPFEYGVTIRPSEVLRLNITLLPQVDRGAGFREHLHDFWGDEQTKVLFDGQLNFDQSVASGGKTGSDSCLYNPTSGTFLVSNGGCQRPIPVPLPDGVIVYPGTARISVKVSWNSEYAGSVGFRYMAANETKFFRAPIPLKSGEEQSFPVEFPMHDHGHQTFSVWSLEVVPDVKFQGYRVVTQSDFNRRFVGPFQVYVVAHRGVVAPEPAHAMFWTNSTEKVLLDGFAKKMTGLPTATKNPGDQACTGSTPCIVMPAGAIVPPGTTRLKVELAVDYGTPALASLFSMKTLAFRTAAMNPRQVTLEDLRVEAAQGPAAKRTWELKLEPKETDAFYQRKSLWGFFLATEGHEREDRFLNECFSFGGAGCGDSIYRLTVIAVNDDFVPAAS
jgi:hypothetical protein